MIPFFLLWMVFGALGFVVGSKKGIPSIGFILGFLAGPLGFVVVVMLDGNRVKCPQCRKLVDPDAAICAYCRSPIEHLPDFQRIPPPKFRSELASTVIRMHQNKNKDTAYVLADITTSPTHEKLRELESAYEELERRGFVEKAGGETEPYPGGPKRPLRRLTRSGRSVDVN